MAVIEDKLWLDMLGRHHCHGKQSSEQIDLAYISIFLLELSL